MGVVVGDGVGVGVGVPVGVGVGVAVTGADLWQIRHKLAERPAWSEGKGTPLIVP